MTWLAIACVMWPATAWLREIIPSMSPTVVRAVCGVALLPVALYRIIAAFLKIRDLDL